MKVLLLEDDEAVYQVVKMIFENLGHDVEVCMDGFEAIKKYRTAFEVDDPFDFVILDINISNSIGGNEVLCELRRIDPDVISVACSGNIETAGGGFVYRIQKPITFDSAQTLLEKIGA